MAEITVRPNTLAENKVNEEEERQKRRLENSVLDSAGRAIAAAVTLGDPKPLQPEPLPELRLENDGYSLNLKTSSDRFLAAVGSGWDSQQLVRRIVEHHNLTIAHEAMERQAQAEEERYSHMGVVEAEDDFYDEHICVAVARHFEIDMFPPGTMAVCLHPSDEAHGEITLLGAIQPAQRVVIRKRDGSVIFDSATEPRATRWRLELTLDAKTYDELLAAAGEIGEQIYTRRDEPRMRERDEAEGRQYVEFTGFYEDRTRTIPFVQFSPPAPFADSVQRSLKGPMA